MLSLCFIRIAGHRHQERCRRHRNSSISARTAAFGFRIGPSRGLVAASAFLFFLVLDWLDAEQSGNKETFLNVERNKTCTSNCRRWKGIYPARPYTAAGGVKLTIWCYKIISKRRNDGKKLVRHRHFFPSVNSVSLASAFRHQATVCKKGRDVLDLPQLEPEREV